MRALLLLVLLGGCASAGSSRECSFARPLVFSRHSIAGLDADDARALLTLNRQIEAVCQ